MPSRATKFAKEADAIARDERTTRKRIDRLDREKAPEKPEPMARCAGKQRSIPGVRPRRR